LRGHLTHTVRSDNSSTKSIEKIKTSKHVHVSFLGSDPDITEPADPAALPEYRDKLAKKIAAGKADRPDMAELEAAVRNVYALAARLASVRRWTIGNVAVQQRIQSLQAEVGDLLQQFQDVSRGSRESIARIKPLMSGIGALLRRGQNAKEFPEIQFGNVVKSFRYELSCERQTDSPRLSEKNGNAIWANRCPRQVFVGLRVTAGNNASPPAPELFYGIRWNELEGHTQNTKQGELITVPRAQTLLRYLDVTLNADATEVYNGLVCVGSRAGDNPKVTTYCKPLTDTPSDIGNQYHIVCFGAILTLRERFAEPCKA